MIQKSFLFLSLFAVTLNAAAQKIAVTKGQKLESVITNVMTMEVMGQNMNNESTVTTEIEVKDVTNKGFTFANTTKKMLVKGSAMGQDINFDSDKKEDMDGQMGQALKGRIGTIQEIVVDKQGKIVEVKDTIKKETGGGINDMMNITGDMAKGQAYPLLIQLPAKAIKPGDTWTDSLGSPTTIKTITTYTLKEVNAEGVIVSFTGSLVKSGIVQQSNMEIQLDMTGTVKGDAVYDINSGFLKKNTTTSDITGSVGVMGQNAPLNMKMTSSTITKKL